MCLKELYKLLRFPLLSPDMICPPDFQPSLDNCFNLFET